MYIAKVKLKEYRVDQQSYSTKLEYEKNINNLEEFKESFLKRLGNVQASSNSNRLELKNIKPIVWRNDNLSEIVNSINKLHRWNIEVEIDVEKNLDGNVYDVIKVFDPTWEFGYLD